MSDIVEIVKKGLNDLDGKYAAKMANLEDMVRDVAQQQSHVPGLSAKTGPGATGSIAKAMLGSEAMQAFRERKSKSAIVATDFGLDVLVKTALVGDIQSDTNQYPGQAFRDPRMGNDVRAPLSLVASLPRLPVTSGSFEFVSLTSAYADDAAYQLTEGAAKHETAMPLELKTATVATVASVLPCSEQVLADNAALSQFISGKMTSQVLQKLEFEIVNGAGGTGEISGLLAEGSVFVQSSDVDVTTAVGEAAAHMQAIGHAPGAVLMHPATWHAARSARADAGNTGVYLAGSWAMPAQPNIWGTPVIPCAAMPLDKVIVLDPSQVVLLDRQSATFEWGWVNDQFSRNIRTGRAELRAGLAVFSATAVQVLTV